MYPFIIAAYFIGSVIQTIGIQPKSCTPITSSDALWMSAFLIMVITLSFLSGIDYEKQKRD
jgi:hypothetical protein